MEKYLVFQRRFDLRAAPSVLPVEDSIDIAYFFTRTFNPKVTRRELLSGP
jgi:hypothetical protein